MAVMCTGLCYVAQKIFILRVQKASTVPGHLLPAPTGQVAEGCEMEKGEGGVSGAENGRNVRRWCAIKGQARSAWREGTAKVGGKLRIALLESVIGRSRTERIKAHSHRISLLADWQEVR